MSTIELSAADGHRLAAWRALPAGAPKGAIVVVQEIFGVNSHIRAVADGFAADGHLALAPALFDRLERGYETGYAPADIAAGRERVGRLDWEDTLADLAAAVTTAHELAGGASVGVVGFCWGGTVAFLSATRLGLPAVAYYGARDVPFLDEPLRAPAMFHFGERDASIPPRDVQLHREKLPQAQVFTYPAGHAFNRDVDPKAYDAASAKLALQRTLDFFAKTLA